MPDKDELKARIERIEQRLDKIEENIDILINPFKGKGSEIFKNLDLKNIAKAMFDPELNINLTKTDIDRLKNSVINELEKRILLLLYKNEQGLSIKQMAEKTISSGQTVLNAIHSLTKKGVSFISIKDKDSCLFKLDKTLIESQAKENFIQFL